MGHFKIDGTRCVDVYFNKKDIVELTNRWKCYVENIKPYPNVFKGKGIVICAGGISYFTCSSILINILRNELKCSLPIEVWYYGNELTEETKRYYEKLNVTCHDIFNYVKTSFFHGWMLKSLAIKYSNFKEILYLDADNVCTTDPEFLFNIYEYKKYGSIFWPDYWHTDPNNQIWEIMRVRPNNMKEQESGQILINKERCWRELNLATYLNENFHIYYNFLLGDKDTFKFSWMALDSDFFFIKQEPSVCGYIDHQGLFCGHTMIQYSPEGQMIFLHRNLIKWDCTFADEKEWKVIKKFKKVMSQSKKYKQWTNGYIDIEGDVDSFDFESIFKDFEDICLRYLQSIRNESFYKDFMIHSYIYSKRGLNIK